MRGKDERPPPVTTAEKQQVPPALVPETLKKPDVPEAQAAAKAPPPAPATSKAPEPAPQVALLMPKEVPPAPPKEVVPPPAPEQKPEKIPPPPVEKVTPPAPPQPVVLRDIPAPEKAPPPEKMTPPPAKPPELAAVPPPAPPSPAKVPAPAPLPSILEAKRPPPPPPAAPARKTAEVMETPAPATGPLPPLDMDEVPNMPAIKEVSPESLEVKGSASRPAPPFPTTPSPGPVPVLRPYSLVQDLPWQAELPSALPPEPGARPEEAPKPDSIDVAALPEMLPSAEGEAAMPEPPPATEAPAKAAEEPKTEAPPAATQPPAPARAKPEKSAEAVKKPEEEAKPAKPNDEAAIREKLAELERAAEKRRPATEIPTPSSEKELDDMPLPPVPPLSGDAAEEVAGLEIDQAKVPGELPAERGKPAKDNGKVEVAQAVRVPLSAPRDVEISSHAKAEDIPKTYAPRLFSPSRKNSGRGFWLQVGTFGSEDMAFRHFDDVISREGLSLRVRVIQHGKETYLRAGPFKTARDAADTCLSFLTDELTCSVVYEVTSSGPAYTQRPRHNGYDRGESTILPDYTYEGPRGRQIYWLQLGTYPSEQEVVEAWKTLSKDQAKTLKDMKLNIQLPRQSSAYERTYRMRAGPLPDQIEAAAKCRELKAANVPCIAVRGD
jgi:hypothetical protein